MIPILIMNLVLVVIAILLIVAERFLVTYGECKIAVSQENEKKEFSVQGGNYLLSVLTENKINISSSCAGKASCGYCKVRVLSGGGPILPTEEGFMSREEKIAGMRLACQVKVKNDLEIYIPDYIEIVKNIVKKRKYDPRLRWKFQIAEQMPLSPSLCDSKIKLSQKDRIKILAIREEIRELEGAVVTVLQKVNEAYSYLPEPVLRYVSSELKLPLSMIYRIATFYNAFSLEPLGKYVITVCTGTACHVKGAEKVVSTLESELGIQREHTTEDSMFTLKTVRCLGCCGLSPVLKVGEEIHGMMDKRKTIELVKMYKSKKGA